LLCVLFSVTPDMQLRNSCMKLGKELHVAREARVGHRSAIAFQCQRKMKLNLYLNAF